MSALRPMELLRVAPTSVGANVQVSVDGATGGAGVRIALPLTAGRDGFGPSLALTFGGYDPLSPFAHGWSLAGLGSVEVDTRDGLPAYDGRETFRYAGQELVPLDSGPGPTSPWSRTIATVEYAVRAFRPRIESSPMRVEQWTATDGRVHWRVRAGDGSVQVLGLRADDSTRLADPRPAFAYRTFRWLLEAAFDRLGNAMVVEYLPEDAVGLDALSVEATRFASATVNRYVERIMYGNAAPLSEANTASDLESASWHFEAVLDYGDHDATTPTTTRSQPWALRQDVGHSGRMGFEVRTRRLCSRVLMFHHFATELGEDETLVGALELAHDEAPDASMLTGVRFVGYRTVSSERVSLATPWASVTYTETATDESFALCRVPLIRGQGQLIDFYGEGLPGVLTTTAAGTYYAHNRGDGDFGAHRPIPSWPRGFDGALQDFDRDGNVELFQPTGPSAGYWRFDRREKRWRSLKRFEKSLSATENVTLADMSGDGRPDVVLFTESGLTWWPNRGEQGFGEPVRVRADVDRLPRPNTQLGRFMADMTGDGLADIVEIKNGSVHYWPNLGRGRFGERVVMASAPRLADEGSYDPARILLVDLDQSGTADLLYVSSSGVFRATNRRGASFGPYERIAAAPRIPNAAQIQLADFYGDGSSCLVVTTTTSAGDSAFQVLRLMRSPGARQVLSVTTPLGAVTELEWGHSTRHYLRDIEEGRGWETPCPAQRPVVDAVHHSEPVDGASMSERFRYHDGHYDARLRSFALFAVVDHVDVDTNASFADVTPLLTRRFLHTGEDDYLSRFARYHYEGEGLLARPPPTGSLETTAPLLTTDYEEAWCALSGSLVREELFALDSSGAEAANPYRVTVSARGVAVTRLADDAYPRPGLRVVQRITGASEYEQAPSNPRDSVGRVLTVDAYLVPTLTMQAGLPLASGAIDPQQGRALATASTTEVVHFDTETRFELAVPVHARTFEVHVPATGALDTVLDDGLASTLADAIADASAYAEPLDPDGAVLAARSITHARSYYWNTARDAALSLGTVLEAGDDVVLPHHTEQAAYDRDQLTAVFDTRFDPDTHLAGLGYAEGAGDDADIFFAIGPTSSFGDASTFYRLEQLEAYDTGVRAIGSDAHHLVTASMTDQVGNEATADIDYHLLAPFRLTDPNGTVQEIDYDPLGVARRTSRYGHALDSGLSPSLLDHGFTALTFGDALPSIDDALDAPETALGGADTLLVYEFGSGTMPMRVLALQAEQFVHRGPDAGAASARAKVSISYIDGFGRELQSRMRVEPGVDDIVGGDADPRYRVTGYIAFDAKGRARQQYEPFFRGDHVFEPALDHRQFGVTTTTTFDALGRPIRQDMPNDTFTETTFTAWSKQTLDPNDTSDRATAYVAAREGLDHDDPEYIALQQALANQETPITVYLDPLGRPVATREKIEDEIVSGSPVEVELVEVASLDIRGLSEKTTDRRELVASTRSFDRLGRLLYESSMDAGANRGLFDAEGREVEHWREDTLEVRAYDVAGRVTDRTVTDGITTWLAEHIAYGEGAAGAADRNQLGRAISMKDAAGVVETPRYGAFGEVLETTRTLVAAAGTDPDWTGGGAALETTSYTTKTATDALGRPTRAFPPDGTERLFGYLRSGPLTTLDVITPDSPTPVTHNILVSTEYNARGQQTARLLGNNVDVSNEYEVDTFRLYRRRADFDGTDTYQDLRHHYDPVGNLVYVDDAAQTSSAHLVISGLAVTAERIFAYDARYQLKSASGRVHQSLTRNDFRGDVPTSGSYRGTQRLDLDDGTKVKRYTRTFSYDHGGNLEGYSHSSTGGGSWNNEKWISDTSNRQFFKYDLATPTPNLIADPSIFFDTRGQITALPSLRSMTWSPRDQLRRVVMIERTGGDPDDDELYDYAADSKRLRKTTNRLVSGNVEKTETIYLDGCELRRVTQTATSTVILERWSSHAEGDDGRIATLYRWVTDTLGRETDDTSVVNTHFHLASNIGSVSLELDDAGAVLSYEEYFPYGSTAFVAGESITAGFRTLRFVGKDQDDSTGFYAFQFRYYAPFIGNWVSPDPAGEIDGPNLYAYCHNDPINGIDEFGLDEHRRVDFADASPQVQLQAATYFQQGHHDAYQTAGFATEAELDQAQVQHPEVGGLAISARSAEQLQSSAEHYAGVVFEISEASYRSYLQGLVAGASHSDPLPASAPPTVGSGTETIEVDFTELLLSAHSEHDGSDVDLSSLDDIGQGGDGGGHGDDAGGTTAPSAGQPGGGHNGRDTGGVGGVGTADAGTGTGAGVEGTGSGGPVGHGSGIRSGTGTGTGAPGSGRGVGSGASSSGRRAPATGGRARSMAGSGGGAPTSGGGPSGGPHAGQGGPSDQPSGTGGMPGGTGQQPSPGGVPGINMTGGSSPTPGIPGSEIGSNGGLNPNPGTEGGPIGVNEGGTSTGSLLGSESGDDRRGSILSGADEGSGDATLVDRAAAALRIANGDFVGYDPHDPAARESGTAGTLGWIDLGFWANNIVGFALAAIMAILGARQAWRAAGDAVQEAEQLASKALSDVDTTLTRLPTDEEARATVDNMVALLEAVDDESRRLAQRIDAGEIAIRFEEMGNDLGRRVRGQISEGAHVLQLNAEFATRADRGSGALSSAISAVHEYQHLIDEGANGARRFPRAIEELRAFVREAEFASNLGRPEASEFARLTAEYGFEAAMRRIEVVYRVRFPR